LKSNTKGYIDKQKREVSKNKKQNNKKIPDNINYKKISGLSNEVVEKLVKSKPETIGSAGSNRRSYTRRNKL
jgi:tRNA uridine 5-carboxymethylaminomethyl modification enzyme